jgi:translation initiation factor 5
MVIKSGIIELKCMACGGRSPVDNRHKLCTFILKNPPTVPTEYEKKAKKASAKAKGQVFIPLVYSSAPLFSLPLTCALLASLTIIILKDENGAEPSEEGNGKQEEDKLPRTSSKSKKKKDHEEDEEDVVWFTDTSKEAAEQRRKNMLDTTSELAAKLLNTGISGNPPSPPPPFSRIFSALLTRRLRSVSLLLTHSS